MAKVSLARKKELNEPDEFISLSNQIAEFASKNKKKVTIVISSLFIVFLLIGTFISYNKYRENIAEVQYGITFQKADDATSMSDADFNDFYKACESFHKKYSGTPADIVGVARFASICYSKGKFEKAAELYLEGSKNVDADSSYSNIMLSGLGKAYESLNEKEKAIEIFRKISSGTKEDKKAEAAYHLAVLYNSIGKKTDRDVFISKIQIKYKNTIYFNLLSELEKV